MFVPREPKRNKAKLPDLQTEAPNSAKTIPLRPSHEEVSLRAYEIYQSGGFVEGRDKQDWLRAEKEVIAKVVMGRLE